VSVPVIIVGAHQSLPASHAAEQSNTRAPAADGATGGSITVHAKDRAAWRCKTRRFARPISGHWMVSTQRRIDGQSNKVRSCSFDQMRIHRPLHPDHGACPV